MAKISTLFYVLENLESNEGAIINPEEIHKLEQKYLDEVFGLLEKASIEVRPSVIEKILQSVSAD